MLSLGRPVPLSYHQLLHTADDGPAWAESVLDAEIGRVLEKHEFIRRGADSLLPGTGPPTQHAAAAGAPVRGRRPIGDATGDSRRGNDAATVPRRPLERQPHFGRTELPDANLAWDADSVMTPMGGPPTVAMTETVGVPEPAPSPRTAGGFAAEPLCGSGGCSVDGIG